MTPLPDEPPFLPRGDLCPTKVCSSRGSWHGVLSLSGADCLHLLPQRLRFLPLTELRSLCAHHHTAQHRDSGC